MANAGVTDNFNSYTDGGINGQGGWNDPSGTFIIQGTITYAGVKAVKCVETTIAAASKDFVSQVTQGRQGIRWRSEQTNSASDVFRLLMFGGSEVAAIAVDNVGNLLFRYQSGADTLAVITASTWYYPEIEWRNFGAGLPEIRARINGGTWTAWRTPTNSGTPTTIQLGRVLNAGTFYWDEAIGTDVAWIDAASFNNAATSIVANETLGITSVPLTLSDSLIAALSQPITTVPLTLTTFLTGGRGYDCSAIPFTLTTAMIGGLRSKFINPPFESTTAKKVLPFKAPVSLRGETAPPISNNRKPYLTNSYLDMMRNVTSKQAGGRHSEGKKPYIQGINSYEEMEHYDKGNFDPYQYPNRPPRRPTRPSGVPPQCSGYIQLTGPLSVDCGGASVMLTLKKTIPAPIDRIFIDENTSSAGGSIQGLKYTPPTCSCKIGLSDTIIVTLKGCAGSFSDWVININGPKQLKWDSTSCLQCNPILPGQGVILGGIFPIYLSYRDIRTIDGKKTDWTIPPFGYTQRIDLESQRNNIKLFCDMQSAQYCTREYRALDSCGNIAIKGGVQCTPPNFITIGGGPPDGRASLNASYGYTLSGIQGTASVTVNNAGCTITAVSNNGFTLNVLSTACNYLFGSIPIMVSDSAQCGNKTTIAQAGTWVQISATHYCSCSIPACNCPISGNGADSCIQGMYRYRYAYCCQCAYFGGCYPYDMSMLTPCGNAPLSESPWQCGCSGNNPAVTDKWVDQWRCP